MMEIVHGFKYPREVQQKKIGATDWALGSHDPNSFQKILPEVDTKKLPYTFFTNW